MITLKLGTENITGKALDWAVAKALNAPVRLQKCYKLEDLSDMGWYLFLGGDEWSPTTNWAQGGPLLDKLMGEVYVPDLLPDEYKPMYSISFHINAVDKKPLPSICRSFVRTKLGDVVEIPMELIK
jgi:Protein of unknown function (DUF2591)